MVNMQLLLTVNLILKLPTVLAEIVEQAGQLPELGGRNLPWLKIPPG
jgi:hypothetical protein